jgi:hypothetical protein
LRRGTGSCTITSPAITGSSTTGSSIITSLLITGSHHTTGSCITTGSQCVDAASLGMTEAKRGGNQVVRRRARRRRKDERFA